MSDGEVVLVHNYYCFDCGSKLYTSSLHVPWCCQDYMTRTRSFEMELPSHE